MIPELTDHQEQIVQDMVDIYDQLQAEARTSNFETVEEYLDYLANIPGPEVAA